METSSTGAYRDQQLESIEGVITYFFNYKGTLEIWEKAKHTFVPIQDFLKRRFPTCREARALWAIARFISPAEPEWSGFPFFQIERQFGVGQWFHCNPATAVVLPPQSFGSEWRRYGR